MSSPAFAEDYDQLKTDIKGLKTVPLKNNGVDGVWFSASDADKILQMLQVKLPKLVENLKLQTDEIANLTLAINNYKASNTALVQLNDTYKKSVNDIANTIKPPEIPWYDKPHTMFAIGATVGALVVFAAVVVVFVTVEKVNQTYHIVQVPTTSSGLTASNPGLVRW